MKIKSFPARFKVGMDDLEEGEFVAYPSTFIREPDSYGDVIARGAFDETIADWAKSGNVMPVLYGHRMDDPDFFVGGAYTMGTDEHGWWIRGKFDLENAKARQTYRLVKGRRLSQLSFAFDVLEEGRVELPDGRTANELRKVKVYEASFVPVGANQDTSVLAVKSAADVLAESVKSGRALSAKNESALREARNAIDSVLASLGGAEPKHAPVIATGRVIIQPVIKSPVAEATDEASGNADEVKHEEPSGVKCEEPAANPSARIAAELQLLALVN